MTEADMRKLEHYAKYARRHAEALYALTRQLSSDEHTYEEKALAGAARRLAIAATEADGALAIYRFQTETP